MPNSASIKIVEHINALLPFPAANGRPLHQLDRPDFEYRKRSCAPLNWIDAGALQKWINVSLSANQRQYEPTESLTG